MTLDDGNDDSLLNGWWAFETLGVNVAKFRLSTTWSQVTSETDTGSSIPSTVNVSSTGIEPTGGIFTVLMEAEHTFSAYWDNSPGVLIRILLVYALIRVCEGGLVRIKDHNPHGEFELSGVNFGALRVLRTLWNACRQTAESYGAGDCFGCGEFNKSYTLSGDGSVKLDEVTTCGHTLTVTRFQYRSEFAVNSPCWRGTEAEYVRESKYAGMDVHE
ncbi:hypothetical protein BS47DRAFT_1402374 [Hydnum rufescens UP504]|uniref:Uncharacterized protein n=1 Tax=Hydnum rufescens UP504 TaxID=1448309 RepID=A0A9P6ACN6_9AGAM|nr:hypothetical protein BS47DRAFT_1402374 [Hydnum rufescens UP504]